MKLVNAKWMLDIDIKENIPAILVLENCDAMTEIVEDLYNLCLIGEGNSVLSDGFKVLPIDKMAEVIVNPFSIDFNSKRIQSKLYSELLEATDLYVEEKAEIQTRIIDYPVPALMARVKGSINTPSRRLLVVLDEQPG